MRADWHAAVAARAEEKEGAHDMDDDWSEEVSGFFQRTKSAGGVSPYKQQQHGADTISDESEKEKSGL